MFNPFPGLRSFEPDEDHLFFGREKQIDEVLRRLRTVRFLSVVGSSGSGKSSLVRSGLIPSLHSGAMTRAGSSWRVAILRPGEDPIGRMAAALSAADVLGNDRETEETNRMLVETTLQRSTAGLIEAVKLARMPAGDNLLVLVDQFEELFRFKHGHRTPDSRDEALRFVKLLLEAVKQNEVPIYGVLTMRSDFIGDCMEFPDLPEAVNAGQYLVPRMTRDELRSAIVGPVKVGGGAIAPRLVIRLLNDVGDDPDQLPVLQHALMRTWDHWQGRDGAPEIDLVDYEAIGTLRDALSLHAEEALDDIQTERGREMAEKVFKALTDTSSDARGTRRPTSVRTLAAICQAAESEVVDVIEVFRRPGRTFLMPPASVPLSSQSIIDLSHESLMRIWKRLIAWAEEERTAAEYYLRLARSAAWNEEGTAGLWRDPELEVGLRWKQETGPTEAWARRYDPAFARAMDFLDRSERERNRLLQEEEKARRSKLRHARQVAGALAALLLVAAGLAVYAWRQQIRANAQRIRADQNLSLAKRAVDEMLTSAGKQSGRVAAEIPEMEEFRKELLEKASDFYSQFGDQRPDSEEFRKEIALAHFRLGDIYRLLQRTDEAARAYRSAAADLEQLVRDAPANPEYRQWLANSYNWLGETVRSLQGGREEAERAYGDALRIQSALRQEFQGNEAYQQELARTHYNRGILLAENEGGDDRDYREAIQLLSPLAEKGSPSALQELARTYNNLGLLLKRETKRSEAEGAFDQAIRIHQELIGRDPENRDYRFELAKFYNNLGILLQEEGKMDLAIQKNLLGLELFEGLARPLPSLTAEIAHSHDLRGRILEDQGKGAQAEREYESAIGMFADAGSHKSIAEREDFSLKYGEALYNLAVWRWKNKDHAGAARLLAQALQHHSKSPSHAVHLAYDYLMLLQVNLDRGAAVEARAASVQLEKLLPTLPSREKQAITLYYGPLQVRLPREPGTRQ